jgi:DNA-binding LacI/PurR family transcriptional regulator
MTALHAHGISPDPDLMARGEGSFEFGKAATERWLELGAERPTAIVALNDTMAVGAMHAAQARGLTVGHDLAVVGFDDEPLVQYLWPPLTSVHQPIREAGRRCVAILVALLEGRTPAERQVLLRPELVVRTSSQGRLSPYALDTREVASLSQP